MESPTFIKSDAKLNTLKNTSTKCPWYSPKFLKLAALVFTSSVVTAVVLALVLKGEASKNYQTFGAYNNINCTNHTGSIYWHSQPIAPNETLLVHGGPWNANDSLVFQFIQLPNTVPQFPVVPVSPTNWTCAKPILQTEYSLSVIVPETFSFGVFAYRLAYDNGTIFTDWNVLNKPDIWFVQGDEVKTASIGGWIGLYGTALLVKNSQTSIQPRVILQSEVGITYQLASSVQKFGNRWAQYFDIPSNVPVGNYSIWYHSGSGGTASWIKFQASDGTQTFSCISIQLNRYLTWPAETIDITKINASTFSQQLTIALKNLTANQGGIIYLPSGTYFLNQAVKLPFRTIIRGAGKSATTIIYNSTSTGTIFTGTSFGAENFTIKAFINSTSNYCGCSVFTKQNSNIEVSWIRDVDMLCPNSIPPENRICNTWGYAPNIDIDQSEGLIVENVYFEDCSNCVSITGYSNYTRITNVDMNFRGQNVLIRCGRNHVMENSKRRLLGNFSTNGWSVGTQAGFLIGVYCSQSMTRDIYYGNNTSSSQMKIWNDNTVADGKEGWYYGKVSSADGISMSLTDQIKVPVFLGTYYVAPCSFNFQYTLGSIVIIVGGKGMGQYRFLASSSCDSTITIDRSWSVVPDSSSTIAISKFKGRILSVSNAFNSEGIHMWHWFSASDIIYADNMMGSNFSDYHGVFYDPTKNYTNPTIAPPTSLSFTGGFRYGNSTFVGFHCGAWYNQAIDNIISENSTGMTMNIGSSGYPAVNSNLTWSKQISFGNVFRNIVNPSNKPFSIQLPWYIGTMVVEGNTNVSLISFSDVQSNVLMRNNHLSFANVSYVCNGIQCASGNCSRCNNVNKIEL